MHQVDNYSTYRKACFSHQILKEHRHKKISHKFQEFCVPAVLAEDLFDLLHVIAVLLPDHLEGLVCDYLGLLNMR